MTTSGRDRLWQSLGELDASSAAAELLGRALPGEGGVDRRQFLRLMGASLALAGLGACTRQPEERIVPRTRQPEYETPGIPRFFATAMPLGGLATGLLVESHEGRPTKIEGNPSHPASLGATDAIAQAAILGLYDPDRSQVITSAGEIRPWSALASTLRDAIATARGGDGSGVRILTETVTSPTLAAQLRALLEELPGVRWHQWEPTGRTAAHAGGVLAFGEPVATRHHLEGANVILALDTDILSSGPESVRLAREWSRRRRPDGPPPMARLYAVETTPSLTGAVADHRLALPARRIEPFARRVAAALGLPLAAAPGDAHGDEAAAAEAVARDLRGHRGASLVVAGDSQPARVHALAHAMNDWLGNASRTVEYSDPVEANPGDQVASLRELTSDMAAGRVTVLLILGANAVATAPADLDFPAALERVPLRVHLGLYDDETAARCHWHVPEAHFLESWGDVRAFDGTVSIVQPLIAPLYDGRTSHELLAVLTASPEQSAHDLVRAHWRRQRPGVGFDAFWRRALHDGVIAGTALPHRRMQLRPDWDAAAPRTPPESGLEITFRPDPHLHDGRFANNAWLQELPRPITRLTWGNAALLAPETAARLGLANGDEVELRRGARAVRGSVWIVPGQAPGSVTVHLGSGRARGGQVALGAGFDAYAIRTTDALHAGGGLEIVPTGGHRMLATTQTHHRMEGRDLVRSATLAEYRAHPDFAPDAGHGVDPDASLHPPHAYEGHAWGMAIDLGACTGCQACVAACQAENNIPVVGEAEVAKGREMHWIRVDRYFTGPAAAPGIVHQPVPCMHCEKAPCEVVCPVNATVHSSEGLNEMVYNRCVGTRYCSNNCPYKVRRFNFHLYNDWTTETLKMARNPDVTVRSRGVMEKCTYCVQRIERARSDAILAGRPIRDGDVVTACQQVCPAEAITFGDLNDPASRVARLRADTRHYALLAELGTRPRTTYLAAVRNPNPALEDDTDVG